MGRRRSHLAGSRAMGDWISMWAVVRKKRVVARLTRRGRLTADVVCVMYKRILREAVGRSDDKVSVYCATGGSHAWGVEAARAIQRLSADEDVPYIAVGEMPVYYTL